MGIDLDVGAKVREAEDVQHPDRTELVSKPDAIGGQHLVAEIPQKRALEVKADGAFGAVDAAVRAPVLREDRHGVGGVERGRRRALDRLPHAADPIAWVSKHPVQRRKDVPSAESATAEKVKVVSAVSAF